MLLAAPYVLDVENGATLTSVIGKLQREQVLAHASDVLLYARFNGLARRIKAGEYQLNAGLTTLGLLQQLAAGQVLYHQVRLGEGWTLHQALEAIQNTPAITARLDADDRDGLQAAFNTSQYPEGWFFPDTYNFTRGTTDLEILQRAKAKMDEVLKSNWAARDSGLPYDSPYQVLIMASIIEKETALASEQALIAGVFVRRLQRNMRLQTDPAVIYGLGSDFDGDLTRRQLQQDTPWNTYTRAGLPATPIALPSLGAIEASVHPDGSDYLYFVARGDGSHYFSSTLEEHNKAVRQYQLK